MIGIRTTFRAVGISILLATSSLPVSADIGGDAGPDPVRTSQGWIAMSGSSLKDTLEGWSRHAGWTVVWDSEKDYLLGASASFPGGFEEAVGRLVDAIYINNPEISATLYGGNKVLRIEQNSLSSN